MRIKTKRTGADISKSISLAVVISYLTMGVSFLTTIFFTPFMLEKVGDDYGVYSFAQSVVSWLMLFSTSFSACYVRYASIEYAKENKTLKTNTIFAILFFACSALILVIGLTAWSLFFFDVLTIDSFTESENALFKIVFLLSIIQCAITVLMYPFTLPVTFKRKFVPLRLATLISGILYPVISFVVLIFCPSMVCVVLVLFITQDVTQIALIVYSVRRLNYGCAKLARNEISSGIKSILVFSIFILINAIVDTLDSSIDKILLGAIRGASFVTIYQLGMSFQTYMTSLSLVLSGNYVPLINQYGIEGNIKSVNSLFIKVGTFQALIIFLIIGGFFSCGVDFVNWWVGPEKSDVFIVGASLMMSASFPLCENISIEYQRCMNKHKVRAFLYAGLTLVNLLVSTLLLIFVPKLNPIISCLLGTVPTSFISQWLVINIYNKRVLKLDVLGLLKNFIFIVAVCSLCVLGTYLISFSMNDWLSSQSALIRFLVKGIVFVALYGSSFGLLVIVFGLYKPSVVIDNLPNKISRMLLFWKS